MDKPRPPIAAEVPDVADSAPEPLGAGTSEHELVPPTLGDLALPADLPPAAGSLDLSPTAGLPPRARAELPRVVNRLLGQTFVYQDKEGDKDDYYFIHRFRPSVAAALALAGFELVHDDYHRIYQVMSRYTYCRSRYPLDVTLMIVVLRKLYAERAETLSLAGDPVVSLAELRDEYRTITDKPRDLGVVQYERLLRRMRRLGLVEPIDGRTIDVRDGDSRLRLRGSVRMILPIQTADELAAWLRRFRGGLGPGDAAAGTELVEAAGRGNGSTVGAGPYGETLEDEADEGLDPDEDDGRAD